MEIVGAVILLLALIGCFIWTAESIIHRKTTKLFEDTITKLVRRRELTNEEAVELITKLNKREL